MLYRTNAEAIRPLHEWTKTFERLWQHQLNRVKERAEAKAEIVRQNLTGTNLNNECQGGNDDSTATPEIENLTVKITQEIHVRAPLEVTFEALLEQMGPENRNAGTADADEA